MFLINLHRTLLLIILIHANFDSCIGSLTNNLADLIVLQQTTCDGFDSINIRTVMVESRRLILKTHSKHNVMMDLLVYLPFAFSDRQHGRTRAIIHLCVLRRVEIMNLCVAIAIEIRLLQSMRRHI